MDESPVEEGMQGEAVQNTALLWECPCVVDRRQEEERGIGNSAQS